LNKFKELYENTRGAVKWLRDDKSVWLVRFSVRDLPVPEAELLIDDKLTLKRISDQEGLVMAHIVTETERDEDNYIMELGKRYLEDFLDAYCLVTGDAAWICSDEGASQLRKREGVGGSGSVFSGQVLVRALPPVEVQRQGLDLAKDAFLVYKSLSEESKRYLRTAMSRFRLSKLADRPDDSLVDLWIGLESLYSIEHEELSYRISHRAATLLTEIDSERPTIFHDLRELYQKRSLVVHGKMIDISPEEVDRLGSYLVESIRRFLKLCRKHPGKEAIIKLLDDCILDNESREKLANTLKEPNEDARRIGVLT